MAQGDGAIYNEAKKEFLNGALNLAGQTMKVMLVTGYTPNIDTHTGYSSVSAYEVTGTGYTTGGVTMTTKSVTKNTTSDKGVFDADDAAWTGLNIGTPSHAILYNDSHASKCVIAYWEVTTPTNGGNYTLQFSADGVLTLG